MTPTQQHPIRTASGATALTALASGLVGIDPSAQHLLPCEQRQPSVGLQAGMGEGAQLGEGVVIQRAPGQVVGHGFTLEVSPHFTRRSRHPKTGP